VQIFFLNAPISNFTKIRPMGSELFHAGGQTDRHDEANSRFYAILRRLIKKNQKLVTIEPTEQIPYWQLHSW